MPSFGVVGVFPPPSTGQSIAFKNFADMFLGSYELIDVSGGAGKLYKIKKTLKYLSAMRFVIFNRKCIYYTLNSGFGLYLDLFFILLCKVLGRRLIIHHHSYGYINSQDWKVKVISLALSETDYFVFLSPKMMNDFWSLYKGDAEAICLNNIFQYDMAEKERKDSFTRARALKIGYLSNLTVDKGFDTVCEIIQSLARLDDVSVEFHIAGPFSDAQSKEMYDQISESHRSMIRYFGPVYGDEKDEFFQGIDLFLFPTRYQNEAQPMVLVEALQYGLPVLSIDRGTIKDLVGEGFTVGTNEDFVERTVEYIRELTSSEDLLEFESERASALFRELEKRSDEEVKAVRGVIREISSSVS